MVREHAALVAQYNAETGARKASVSTKIGKLEIAMLTEGLLMGVRDDNGSVVVGIEGPVTDRMADFDHWSGPVAYVRKFATTPEQVLELIAKYRAMRANQYLPDKTREDAEKRLAQELENASRRGIDVPEGFDPRAARKAA
jgi:hypothetical protein